MLMFSTLTDFGACPLIELESLSACGCVWLLLCSQRGYFFVLHGIDAYCVLEESARSDPLLLVPGLRSDGGCSGSRFALLDTAFSEASFLAFLF